ncbi:MAG: tetratricopeptide repeat protein [Bacteroidetes bacterium]|nr:tetratricopeptide repeat protein [Bacteroidota bacterium]
MKSIFTLFFAFVFHSSLAQSADSLNQRAKSFFYLNPDSAEFYANQAALMAATEDSLNDLAEAFSNVGFALLQKGLASEAHQQFLKAYGLYIETGSQDGIGSVQNYIGNVYSNQGRFREALSFFKNSLQTYLKAGISNYQARQTGNIGITYQKLGIQDSALVYLNESVRLYASGKVPENADVIRIYLGRAYLALGKTDSARILLKSAVHSISNHPEHLKFLAVGYLDLAGLNIKEGKTQEARLYLDSAFSIVEPHDFKNEIRDFYRIQAEYFELAGKPKEALSSYKNFIRIRELLRDDDISRMTADFQNSLDTELKRREIEFLKTDIRAQNQTRIFLIITVGSLVLFSIGLGVFLFLYRKKSKELEESHDSLKITNNDLQEALENVKVLKGFIPICANCKKVRDDSGFWSQIESYIMQNSEAQISHGICPDCMEGLYGIKKK